MLDSLRLAEEPDDFYEFTAEDYYRIHATRKLDKLLKTRKIREAEEAACRSSITKAVIRVRFPDNYTLEATFHPSEAIQNLVDLLKKVVAQPELPFYIYTTPPKKQVQDMSQDFFAAGFVPGAIVYFSYDLPRGDDNVSPSGPFLREDVLSLKDLEFMPEQAEPAEVAPEPVLSNPSPAVPERKRTDKKTVKPKWLKLQVRRPSTITELVALDPSGGCLSPNPLDRGKTSLWNLAKSSPLSSPEPPSESTHMSSLRAKVLSPPHLWASRNLPRPSASSPLDNKAPPMANASQVPDLEGLHHEIHGMAEQMRVMNENNARLIQLLAAANPQPPAAPSVPDVERSRHSNRSGIVLTTSVPNEQEIGTEHQVRPYVKGVPLRNLVKRDPELDAINTGTNAPITVDALVRQTDPPFTERVLRTRISSKFKLPTQLGIYEGKTDPMDHLDWYKSLMSLQGCSDEVMCKAFSATLKGPARSWFRKLSPGTVDSFGELSRLFVANFMSCRNRQKNASHLFTVHQKETESLKDFVKRFNQAVLDVEDPSDKVIIMAMMEGLRPGPLFDSLSKNVPETLSALQSKADKYIARGRVGRPNAGDEERRIIREKNLIRGELIIGRK
ncbi:plant UBX domain-containing protein 1 [Actinidia rufa]|uniref:Plant UBX domain-containing protein 1 n=1 Tax=Actinidia rufa TaxID=165716 RepID=A0A7J0ELL1_9ERIC|nr:plant UBX domain-containing protein 1 [Actinidia rufa]